MVAVTFPDPVLSTLEVLRSAFSGLEETQGVSLGSLQIEEAAEQGVRLPYGRASLDGSSAVYPVAESSRVRVTFWAAESHEALRLAQVARALLRDFAGSASVRGFGGPEGGLYVTEDPDSGQPMAAFSITCRTKPETL